MNVEERARAAVQAGVQPWVDCLDCPAIIDQVTPHVTRFAHELLASPLPAPMTPAELAKAEALARRIDAQFGSDRLGDILTSLTLSFTEEDSEVIGAVVVVFRRLLDHALRLGDDVRRMAQDNGYLEGLAEGEKRGRAPLLALLRTMETSLCNLDWTCTYCRKRCGVVGHAPDCALARALAEGG